MTNQKKSSENKEKEQLVEIRAEAIEEVQRLKKEGKSITTNAVEVTCK